MLRVVLDTNVLVSATISNGRSRELLRRGMANRFSIIISDLILQELESVLSRSEFKIGKEEINMIILTLKGSSEFVRVTSKLEAVKADPKDDMIIETAYDANADMIVSGDSHLLALHDFRGIKIVTVQKMLELI